LLPEKGHFPRKTGFPKRRGMNPKRKGMNPKRRGMNPKRKGMNPKWHGDNPARHGQHPMGRGENPMAPGGACPEPETVRTGRMTPRLRDARAVADPPRGIRRSAGGSRSLSAAGLGFVARWSFQPGNRTGMHVSFPGLPRHPVHQPRARPCSRMRATAACWAASEMTQ
jgi:hypothetical protein